MLDALLLLSSVVRRVGCDVDVLDGEAELDHLDRPTFWYGRMRGRVGFRVDSTGVTEARHHPVGVELVKYSETGAVLGRGVTICEPVVVPSDPSLN